MPEPTEMPETDLDTQLRGLFQEAEQKIQGRTAPKPEPEKDAVRQSEERVLKAYTSLPQMLQPLVHGLEAISRATGNNAQVLQRIDRANVESVEAQRTLPNLITSLESLLDQKNGVNQRMFDTLHEQLKDYKDGFLLESILKPILRDLISLYDDLTTVQGQMHECRTSSETRNDNVPLVMGSLVRMEMNLAHHCEFILEILARLEVTMMPVGVGRLDKQTQRAVSLEMVEDLALDMTVVRSVKRGFMWKDRILRPEEVVMNKWRQPGLAGPTPNPTPVGR